jgi:putative membrane protein
MGPTLALTSTVGSVILAAAWAQGPELWGMHDRLDWGMWFGPLFALLPLALLIIAVVFLIRWLGGRATEGSSRGPRDILDSRYARGELNREEYLRRRDDLTGR